MRKEKKINKVFVLQILIIQEIQDIFQDIQKIQDIFQDFQDS